MRSVVRTRLLVLLVFTLVSAGPGAGVQAKSLFEEEEKDAESALTVDVEGDRSVRVEENRRFVQSQKEYLLAKIKKLEEALALLAERQNALEAELKALKEKNP